MKLLIAILAANLSGFVGWVFPSMRPAEAPRNVRDMYQTSVSTSSASTITADTKPSIHENDPYIPKFPTPGIFSVVTETNPPKRPPIKNATYGLFETPPPRDLGPTQTILTYPLSGTCVDQDRPHLSVTLTRALLITDLYDLHTLVYDELLRQHPEIGTDAFLIIEGRTAYTKNTVLDMDMRASRYMLLHRANQNYQPGAPYTGVKFDTSVNFLNGYFPVKPDEKKFSLLWCYQSKPTEISIDFSAREAGSIQGKYDMEKGVQ